MSAETPGVTSLTPGLDPEPEVVYFRSRDGRTIHHGPCRRRGAAVPWGYADGMSPALVMATIKGHDWLAACRVCWPSSLLDNPEAGDGR